MPRLSTWSVFVGIPLSFPRAPCLYGENNASRSLEELVCSSFQEKLQLMSPSSVLRSCRRPGHPLLVSACFQTFRQNRPVRGKAQLCPASYRTPLVIVWKVLHNQPPFLRTRGPAPGYPLIALTFQNLSGSLFGYSGLNMGAGGFFLSFSRKTNGKVLIKEHC